MMDTISPDVKNKRLTDAYYSSCYYASQLRVKLSFRSRIPKSTFRHFKGSFDYLYQISCNRSQLEHHTDLIYKVKQWLLVKNTNIHNDYVELGIELFDEYQKAMIDNNMITDSQ